VPAFHEGALHLPESSSCEKQGKPAELGERSQWNKAAPAAQSLSFMPGIIDLLCLSTLPHLQVLSTTISFLTSK
jgi:hypothetical protein